MSFLLPGVLITSMEMTANCSSAAPASPSLWELLKMLTAPAKCGNVWHSFKDPQVFGKSALSLVGTSKHLSPVEQEPHSSPGMKGGHV